MESITYISLFFAIISPVIWAMMNLLDKYVVEHKTKNVMSFTLVSGFIGLLIGVVMTLFLDWSFPITVKEFIIPAVAGIIFGLQYYLYFYLISKEDVSHVIGLVYFYPIVTAVLSFFFLSEKLSLVSYLGIFLVITGAVMISVKISVLKSKVFGWGILLLIITTAVYEFLFKVSTTSMPESNGLAITQIFIGISVLFGFFHKKTRKGFLSEMRNIKWIVLAEVFTFFGTLTTFFAMNGLSATIVATIGATQPLIVLLLERAFHFFGIRVSEDIRFLPKLIPISLIVIGIIILSIG